jgi:disulfide bond formation protein DsbB
MSEPLPTSKPASETQQQEQAHADRLSNTSPDADERLRMAIKLFDHIEGQIARTDTKAQLIVAADTLLVAATSSTKAGYIAMLLSTSAATSTRLELLYIIAMFIAAALSFYFAARVVRPSTKPLKTVSLMFFEQIASQEEAAFVRSFEAQSGASLLDAVLGEVHAKSRIAREKYRSIRASVDWLTAALIFWAAAELVVALA